MKIFKNNLNKNYKLISFKEKVGIVGKTKYLPSFSKEWKNIIYFYNKNNLKNIPTNNVTIEKIIESYFNLYHKHDSFLYLKKSIPLKKRRNFLKRIYVSKSEIKLTNNKALVTLYVINRERYKNKKNYLIINTKINKYFIDQYLSLYKKNIYLINEILNKYINRYNISPYKLSKSKYLSTKLNYLNKLLILKNLYLKKLWTNLIISGYWMQYLKISRKYNLLYSLNNYKFNNKYYLSNLSNLLTKIIGKKIEYRIINLKSIAYNTDISSKALALKLKKTKGNYINNMFSILSRAYLPISNLIKGNHTLNNKIDLFLTRYKDLNLISNINNNNDIDELLGNSNNIKEIRNIVYNSIKYKNMSGIRLEVKGRLTKRYRADRSVNSLKWKGGLKNVDSSFKHKSSVLFRGNLNSNVSYSMFKSKRRIGAFAVKGWISGKS